MLMKLLNYFSELDVSICFTHNLMNATAKEVKESTEDIVCRFYSELCIYGIRGKLLKEKKY